MQNPADSIEKNNIYVDPNVSTNPIPTKHSYLLSELPIHSDILYFGMNFKYTKVAKKGLLNRIKDKKQSMDLDLSCILFDKDLNIVDTVWFKQLRDSSEAIRHRGDSLNGRDRGDAAEVDHNVDVETIELRLSRLPLTVTHITLLVSSYYGNPIKLVSRGDLYISDDEGNEIFSSNLTTLNTSASAIYVAELSRELNEWRYTVHNFPLSSHKMEETKQQVQHELARLYSADQI